MAIAYDSSSKSLASGVSSITFSHTTSGTNRILFVAAQTQTSGASITSVTYNGVAMTQIGSNVVYTPNGAKGYLFYLINPASGVNNVVVTASASTSVLAGYAVSYTGAKQTGQPDGSATAQDEANISADVTVTASNCWMVAYVIMFNKNAVDVTPSGSLSVERQWNDDNGLIADSNGTISTGTVAAGFTGSATNVGMIAASFAPAITDITMVATTGTGTITGKSATLTTLIGTMIASAGSAIITGFSALFRFTGWSNVSKNSSTFTNQSKNTSTFTNQSKNSSTWNNQSKS